MKLSSFSVWASLGIGGLAFAASGCQVLFGDYSMSSGAGGGPGVQSSSAAGSAGASTACDTNGAHRCTGSKVEICEAHKWTEKEDCGTQAQCNAVSGACRSCEPDSLQCAAYRLQQCSAAGDGWSTLDTCVKAERCNTTTSACDVCETDEARCDGQYLKICNATHTGWDVIDCGDPNHCNIESRACRPCSVDDYQCNEASLQRCNENLEWVTVQECASGGLCDASLVAKAAQSSNWNGKCVAPVCDEGVYRCNPNDKAQLQVCPPSRDKWELFKSCITAELCDATAGKCKDGCQPGAYLCRGADLLQCKIDGTAYERVQLCESPTQCNAEKHVCYPCNEGEYGCNGATLQRCTANRQWDTVMVCSTAELCSQRTEQSTCRKPGCPKAGTYDCDGEVLRYCPASLLAWAVKETCDTAGLCDADPGMCHAPLCAVGEYRCTGQVRERCNDQRSGWLVDQTCATGQLCVKDLGCRGECPTPARQCNGKLVEECYVDTATQTPKWITAETCASAALCDTLTLKCKSPLCNLNQYQCAGQQLQRCNADQTKWDVVKSCAAGQTCDDAGAQCDLCTAGWYQCNGTSLTQCDSAGQAWTAPKTCIRCETSADKKTGSCYKCNAGDKQCSGVSQIQECADSGLDWDAPSTCTEGYGCQDNGSADFCAQCPKADQTDCTTDKSGIHTCATNRISWSATTTCQYGCVDNATGNDVCDTACPKGITKCESVDGSNTGLNTCSADGSGWLGIKQECANKPGSLKLCESGAFSTTKTVDCLSATPICAGNKCVACDATSPECTSSNSVSRSCVSGEWVSTTCSGTCNPATGTCVECLASSATATCVNGDRRYCAANNTWQIEDCSGTCVSGACVACLDSPWACTSRTVRERCNNNQVQVDDCSTTSQVCSAGACVQCAVNTDCTAPTGVCSSGNKCVQCAASTDCSAPTGVCSSASTCVQCAVDGDCTVPSTPHCDGSVCYPCTADAHCPGGTCVSHACVPNSTDPVAGAGTGG